MIEPSYPCVSDNSEKILCFYANTTSTLQIAKIVNIPDFMFERVVFPGQRIMFTALPSAIMEVYTSANNQSVLVENIVCDRIQVNQENGVLQLENPSGLVSSIA